MNGLGERGRFGGGPEMTGEQIRQDEAGGVVGRNPVEVGPEPIRGLGELPSCHQRGLLRKGGVAAVGARGGDQRHEPVAHLADEPPRHDPQSSSQDPNHDRGQDGATETGPPLGDEVNANQTADHQPGKGRTEDDPDPHDPLGGVIVNEVWLQ